MPDRDDRPVGAWDGALGPQSGETPAYYELQVDGGRVLLSGPKLGQLQSYDLEAFRALVAEGEWLLADEDPVAEVYRTPDGEVPF